MSFGTTGNLTGTSCLPLAEGQAYKMPLHIAFALSLKISHLLCLDGDNHLALILETKVEGGLIRVTFLHLPH